MTEFVYRKTNKSRFSIDVPLIKAEMSCILTNSCRVASAMNRIFQERVVPAELDALRADKVAASLFSNFSRNDLAHWIKVGDLSINGERKKTKDKLGEGDGLILDVEIVKTEEWHKPEKLDLDVV